MNRVHHESPSASVPYHYRPRTVRCLIAPTGVRLSRKLKKPVETQRAEKTIGVNITMIIEAEEWARRALAAQGFGDG